MGLHLVEELRKGGCTSCGIGSVEFCLGVTVVDGVLCEKGGEIAEDERGKVSCNEARLEGPGNGGEDKSYLWQELFVVAGDLCPPRVNISTEGYGDEVVNLCVEFR